LIGVEGRAVSVEVHVTSGLPSFNVVGLPDASCREARDRVRAAVISSGMSWPLKRTTVNLAPSSLRKGGAGLDLPIAVALLAADGQLPAASLEGISFLGELGLDGAIRRVPGVLPLVDAIKRGLVVVPAASAAEASLIAADRVRAATTLRRVVAALCGEDSWPVTRGPTGGSPVPPEPDLADVRGQPVGRLAVEVAAAGGHNLLLTGPPGAGKTMLAMRLPGLLPDLSTSEALEVARIHSAAGLPLPPGALLRRPPCRAPHHSASPVSLIGGGSAYMRPGEISAAHRGVLFMDELAEFPSDVLDTLRQPLEAGHVVVCRARGSVVFPASFLLVAAMNPCPCGGTGAPGSCLCSDAARRRYAARLSGPLLDRFDLRVVVDRPDVSELLAARRAPEAADENTAAVSARVRRARSTSAGRGFASNAQIPGDQLDHVAPLSSGALALLETRLRQGTLSARGLHRVRRVARTLADLGGNDGPIRADDVHSAICLRSDPFQPGELAW
jgi:magnesium chelatase family protein